jgi:MFS family permease
MHPAATGAAADLFQGRHFGSIFGGITFGFGIGGAPSSWLGGYLFDKMGSYHVRLILAMVAIVVALASMWLAAPRKVIARGANRVI